MICAMYLVLVKEVECSKYPKIIIDCIHPQDNYTFCQYMEYNQSTVYSKYEFDVDL